MTSDFSRSGSSIWMVAVAQRGRKFINPWSVSTLKNLPQKMNSKVVEYEGYLSRYKAYPGKVALSSLLKSTKNKSINIGGENYQIKGHAG
ncbi:non-specific serine/threonine protein kinase [Salvia divinorum]|uniref:Non-specific serine/threonine protein kinase n=1 Tax=Salvia divinorum TaxID=28513 RepID=A0ABD1HW25_SALDI